MTARVSALLLAALIMVSAALTRTGGEGALPVERAPEASAEAQTPPLYYSFQANAFSAGTGAGRGPSRDWNVLDPRVDAAAALVYSLDDEVILLGARTYARWPMASLTKLLTSVVVAENIGYHKRVPMTETAIATEGNGVMFNPNEEFAARDLARIMIMASSNDAAVAFEEHVGGREEFLKLLRGAATKLGMDQTTLSDAAGLSAANESSASDLMKLVKYLASSRPEILEWTRHATFIFQPTNAPTSRTVANIVPFADDPRFLGGKTGTLPEARENFAGLFSLGGRRVVVVILGSRDRVREVNELLDWTMRAYHFN